MPGRYFDGLPDAMAGGVLCGHCVNLPSAAAMIGNKRDRFSGITVAEWLACVANELPVDAVGLWQIIPKGRHDFYLDGDDLVEFTRRAIVALLERGARPVRSSDRSPGWQLDHSYGETPEQIADAVITEWLAPGVGDPKVGDVWFATPDRYID